MKYCFIMIGVPGSGKSTLAKQLIGHLIDQWSASVDNIGVFSLDAVRLKIAKTSDYAVAFANWCNLSQKECDSIITAEWNSVIKNKNIEYVIVDNTNLTKKSRARWINDARIQGYTIVSVKVDVPLDVAISRQSTRGDKSVPEQVIRERYMRAQEVFVGSEVDQHMVFDGTKEFKFH